MAKAAGRLTNWEIGEVRSEAALAEDARRAAGRRKRDIANFGLGRVGW